MVRLMIDDLYEVMPWEALDNVVFDVGNVLLSFNPQQILEELIPDASLYPVLLERVFHSPYWLMQDRGLLTSLEAIPVMVGRHKELEAPIRTIMEHWRELKQAVPEGVEALRAAKAHGKRIYILSNYGKDAFAYIQQQYDFFELVDGFTVSSRLGLCKPDPAIYRHVIQTWDLNAERTLFIDDSPANIECALHEGWQGFCLNRPGKLHDFLHGPVI